MYDYTEKSAMRAGWLSDLVEAASEEASCGYTFTPGKAGRTLPKSMAEKMKEGTVDEN